MPVATSFNPTHSIRCGACDAVLAPSGDGPLRCPVCNWTGEAYFFSPRVIESQAAETALPDDATCIHHPRKKATAVCAGTGDYIGSLCSVELNGQTYSAEYLNSAGKEKAGKAFDRILPRPDGQIYLYLVLFFIPYINAVIVAFAFLWIPHAFYLYFKALRMRRENEVFNRVMSKVSVVTIPILLGLYSIGWLAGVAGIVYLVMERHR